MKNLTIVVVFIVYALVCQSVFGADDAAKICSEGLSQKSALEAVSGASVSRIQEGAERGESEIEKAEFLYVDSENMNTKATVQKAGDGIFDFQYHVNTKDGVSCLNISIKPGESRIERLSDTSIGFYDDLDNLSGKINLLPDGGIYVYGNVNVEGMLITDSYSTISSLGTDFNSEGQNAGMNFSTASSGLIGGKLEGGNVMMSQPLDEGTLEDIVIQGGQIPTSNTLEVTTKVTKAEGDNLKNEEAINTFRRNRVQENRKALLRMLGIGEEEE